MNPEPLPPQESPIPEQTPQTATVVHVARPLEPEKLELTPEQRRRHERSLRLYPGLNLSEGEWVISAVRRHPIGLFLPLLAGVLLISAALSILANYDQIIQAPSFAFITVGVESIMLPVIAFVVAVALGMFIAYYVYVNNKFFLTNESVIQEIQHSIFSHHEQTVSLGNIEDASYTRRGIIQHLLNYGDIRLSTEGEETTYRFSFVAAPKEHIAQLNNAVEAFKNGRPVTGD